VKPQRGVKVSEKNQPNGFNPLIDSLVEWADKVRKDETVPILARYPWSKEKEEEFSKVPVQELIENDYFLGLKNQVFPAVMDDIISLFEEREKRRIEVAIFEEAWGSGKCVTGDTLVFTEDGVLYMEELARRLRCEDGWATYTAKVATVDGYKGAGGFYANGRTPTVRIKLRLGFEIEGTVDHPVLTLNDDGCMVYKPLLGVREGDYVAVKVGSNLWGRKTDLKWVWPGSVENGVYSKRIKYPEKLTVDLAYLLGLLVGDGGLTGRYSITFTSADEGLLEWVTKTMWSVFGVKATIVRSPGKCPCVSASGVRLVDFFDRLGMCKLSYDKEVPKVIREAPREYVIAFLQGLFDTDGWVERGAVGLASASERLIRQVQLILLNLGIVASIWPKHRKGYSRTCWTLEITGSGLRQFKRIVGFRLKRKSDDLKGFGDGVGSRSLSPVLPPIKWAMGRWLEGLCRLGDMVWLPVVGVADGEAETYDLEVPMGHNFVANGIVSHNTTKSAIITWILWYRHLGTVHRPQRRYGLADNSHIAIMTFSRSAKQSAKVTYDRIRPFFYCPFNRDYFPPDPTRIAEVRIPDNKTVIFPGTSTALSALGYDLFGCVDESTVIATPRGDVKIAELEGKSDLYVTSYDVVRRCPVVATAEAVVCKGVKDVWEIEMGSGYILRATEDHKVLVKTSGGILVYKTVAQIGEGDDVVVRSGTTEVTSKRYVGHHKVYDVVGVEPHQNFIANGVVVHNCVIDEANFFQVTEGSKRQSAVGADGMHDAAEEMFNTVYARMFSRFGKDSPCLIVLISSKNYAGDFLERKVAEYARIGFENAHVFYRSRPHWEAKPWEYSGEKVLFDLDRMEVVDKEYLKRRRMEKIEAIAAELGIEDVGHLVVPGGEVDGDTRA